MSLERTASLFRMARRNVRRHVRHARSAVLALAVGFVAFGLFQGYLATMLDQQATNVSDRHMLGDLLVERAGSGTPEAAEDPWRFALDEPEQAFIDRWLAARFGDRAVRVRMLRGLGLAGTGGSGAIALMSGTDVAEGAIVRRAWRWNVTAGRPLQEAGGDAAVLGLGLGAVLDCALPDGVRAVDALGDDGVLVAAERPFVCRRDRVQLTATTVSGQTNVIDLPIAGLLDGGAQEIDQRIVELPLPVLQRLLDTKAVTRVAVRLPEGSDLDEVAAALVGDAKAAGFDLAALPWSEHPLGELYRQARSLLDTYRDLVTLIVCVIAGLSVLTAMMRSVAERIREIGTLRALGYLRRHVVALFAMEAGLLGLVGVAIGLVVCVALTAALNGAGITYRAGVMAHPIPLTLGYEPGAWLAGGAALAGLAMLAAVLPARRAVKRAIPDALAST
ncbi:MAG: FtsX-like permease family protein [Myxococcales bacterium]|nr:FtsX-like permease family protein [Myxococcales bacterium]MCB9731646.1 FtsX-like permease family protein [Deltaproteobacteria bacterium]